MNQVWSGNECEKTLTLTTTPQAPKTHKKDPTVRQAIKKGAGLG